MMVPISLDDQLVEGAIEFAINMLVEERMDMSRFDGKFKNDETGCKAYNPRMLLKIILLAYARGIVHSRKIPDHSTIAAFVSSMKEEIKPLFRDVLLVCEEMKLLGGTEFSLDGCKLASNASRRWSGTFATLKAKKEKLERRVEHMLSEQVEADKKEARDEQETRGKYQEKLRKQAGKIEEFLEKNEPKPGKQRKEVQSNVTDNESATMTTAHGTIQGYNGQALVDAKHQVIVSGEAFGSGQDQYHLEPVLTEAQKNMKTIGKDEEYFKDTILTADMAYHSGESIKRCEEEEIDAYIPDKNYRKRHPELGVKKSSVASRRRKFLPEDFSYDEKTGDYKCPAGKRLKRHTRSYNTRWGTMYWSYRADPGDCEVCTHREGCISKKGTKGKRKYLFIPIESKRRNYSQEMAAKMDTERGREIYPHRIKIVEPVFANIRIVYGTQYRKDSKLWDCVSRRIETKQ
jgi:transposase